MLYDKRISWVLRKERGFKMRIKYIADDGTEFDESELCEAHESELAK